MRRCLLALYLLTAILVIWDENDEASASPVVQVAQAQAPIAGP